MHPGLGASDDLLGLPPRQLERLQTAVTALPLGRSLRDVLTDHLALQCEEVGVALLGGSEAGLSTGDPRSLRGF